ALIRQKESQLRLKEEEIKALKDEMQIIQKQIFVRKDEIEAKVKELETKAKEMEKMKEELEREKKIREEQLEKYREAMVLDPRFKIYFIIESLKKISIDSLIKATGIAPVQVRANLAWLERAGMVKVEDNMVYVSKHLT
ncbi:MAG: hypothetical protein KIH08_09630, partial [Candidatus Freyarchaeota archaeon]|nr:hypothetical protein [Candidatus Jordarchaeia archaeon]